ncbi:MAG: hypothetical protein WBD36_01895 [Bacteroidota bacterium]
MQQANPPRLFDNSLHTMLTSEELFWPLLPIVLYAETHYRFKFFLSLLKKREPELIADAPHRLEPGQTLPLLILVKDAHQFPCLLKEINIEVIAQNRVVMRTQILKAPVQLEDQLWWNVFSLKLGRVQGWIDCFVAMTIEYDGLQKTYYSDNHRTSSHRPLRIYVAGDPLPRFPFLQLGEAHSHTSHTSDQVEFGSPIPASVELAGRMGLSFFCATDHSYDLDDHPDDYLSNHPGLPKWNQLQQEVREANSHGSRFAVLRGEEVSCRNERGENVHLLLFGTKIFFHGSGDSAERWFRTRSENSAKDVLARKESGTVAFAAHAREAVPFLQKVLLGRGFWSDDDLCLKGLRGFQFANGRHDEGFEEGYRTWIRLLLRGHRLTTIAGNDAHGNFNRFRQIGIPFLSVRETNDQIFGKMRTGIFAKRISEDSLLQAFGAGECIITDGPVANLSTHQRPGQCTSIGGTFRGRRHSFVLEARSSREFGTIQSMKVFLGVINTGTESMIFSKECKDLFSYREVIRLQLEEPSYIRAEVSTSADDSSDGSAHFCFTNPAWLNPS